MSTLDNMKECFERSGDTCCDLTAEEQTNGTRSMCVRLNDKVKEPNFKGQWNKVDDLKGMSADDAYERFQKNRCVLNEGGWTGAGGYLGRFPNLYRYTSDDKCWQAYVCNRENPGRETCTFTKRKYSGRASEPNQPSLWNLSYIEGETVESSPTGIPDAHTTKNKCLDGCKGYACNKYKCEVSPWANSEYATVSGCEKKCGVSTYSCEDKGCILDKGGPYETLEDCEKKCGVTTYACKAKKCTLDKDGPYASKQACEKQCRMGYDCRDGESGECDRVMEGKYDGLTECKLACISDDKEEICKQITDILDLGIDLCDTQFLSMVTFIILVWIGIMIY
jgi:hypothetical protein